MPDLPIELRSFGAVAGERVAAEKIAVKPTLDALALRLGTLNGELSSIRASVTAVQLEKNAQLVSAADKIRNLLDSVAEGCNSVIDSYSAKFDSIVTQLSASELGEASIRAVKVGKFDPTKSVGAFVVHSNIRRVLSFRSARESFVELLDSGEDEIKRMIADVGSMPIDIFTPAVSLGRTRDVENHSRYRERNSIVSDNRRAVFEDDGIKLLKKVFGDQNGKFDLVQFKVELSRTPTQVTVNPYACFWSGEVNYDDVTYEHFFRWRLSFDLRPSELAMSKIAEFNIESLSGPIEYMI